MQITETQIAQVNKQIKALLSAESFYGKKLEEAGVTSIQSAEDFQKLPFSEKNDLRNAYPLGLMTAPEEKNCPHSFIFRYNRTACHHPIYPERC